MSLSYDLLIRTRGAPVAIVDFVEARPVLHNTGSLSVKWNATRSITNPNINGMAETISWVSGLFSDQSITNRSIAIPTAELHSKFNFFKAVAYGTIPWPYILSVSKQDEEISLAFAKRFIELLGRLVASNIKTETNGSLNLPPGPFKKKRNGATVVFDIDNPIFDSIRRNADGMLPIPLEQGGLTTQEARDFIDLFGKVIITWKYVSEVHPDLLEKESVVKKRDNVTLSTVEFVMLVIVAIHILH